MSTISVIENIKNSGLFDVKWYLDCYSLSEEEIFNFLPQSFISEFNLVINSDKVKLTKKIEYANKDIVLDNNKLNLETSLLHKIDALSISVIEHYLTIGWKKGLDPSKDFSTSFYLYANPDVERANVNPLLHYVLYGRDEKRKINSHRPTPSFSFVMTTYNRKSIISNAIDSVLRQKVNTNVSYELVIVDDGSTDGSFSFLENKYKKELLANKIKLIKSEHVGVSKARNIAVSKAAYEWICYIDDDNTIKVNYLETFLTGIRCNYFSKFVYAQLFKMSSKEIVGHLFDREQLLRGNFIDLGTLCHTKEIFDKIGGFDEELSRFVDWDLVVRMSSLTKPIFLPYVILEYNDSNHLTRITSEVETFGNLHKLQEKILCQLYLFDSIKKTEVNFEKQIEQVRSSLATELQIPLKKIEINYNKNIELFEEITNRLTKLEKENKVILNHLLTLQEKQKFLDVFVNKLSYILLSSVSIWKYRILKTITWGQTRIKLKKLYKIIKDLRRKNIDVGL